MAQLLFYEDAVPVNAERHRDLSVKTGTSYQFASKVNSVPLTAIEFGQAAAEYPIVFAGSEEVVMPCVILGASASKNVFVTDTGTWGGRYIPAFIRRYPFVFSQDSSGKNLILHVDESFEGCNREGHGERLFDTDGNRTLYLRNVLNFLQDYQMRFNRTRRFCERLKELELLRTMEASFNTPDGERHSLSGFMTVDRDKLKALPADELAQLMAVDELECIFLHLFSLRHFGSIAEKFSGSGVQPAGTSPDSVLEGAATEVEEVVVEAEDSEVETEKKKKKA
jgi:SapC